MLLAIAYLLLAQAPAGVIISVSAYADVIELRDQAATHHCDARKQNFHCDFPGVAPGPIEVSISAPHGPPKVFHGTAPDRDATFRFRLHDGGSWKRPWASASAGVVALGGLGIGVAAGGKPVQILSPILLASGLAMLMGSGLVDTPPRAELVRVADTGSTGRRVYLRSAGRDFKLTLVSPDGERECQLPCELQGVPAGKAKVQLNWFVPIDRSVDDLSEEIDTGTADAAFSIDFHEAHRSVPGPLAVAMVVGGVGGLVAVFVGAVAPDTTRPLERIGGFGCAIAFGTGAILGALAGDSLHVTPSVIPAAGGAALGLGGVF